jgi:hypothetical protein
VNIEGVLQALGRRGITVILKIDHERVSDESDPWTVVMSGPGVGEGDFIRIDAASMAECVNQAIDHLCEKPGDWRWVTSLITE